MTEIRPPPKLISPPAPEYAPRIAANRHEQLTELEQDFERGLKTGKERDIFLLVERIKWMIMTIDQSSQHHEIPGHDRAWQGKFRRLRRKNGVQCLEIYTSTILAEKKIHGASYPWLTLPRLAQPGVVHKVNLSTHPYFQHVASPEDHWTFLGEKVQVLVGWSEVVRTSWQLIHGPGVTQLVRVDFYDRR